MHVRSHTVRFSDVAAAARTTIPSRILGTAARLLRAWQSRRQVQQLLAADDYMLADLGLTRHDVTGALSAPLDADPSHHLIRARGEKLRARSQRRLGM